MASNNLRYYVEKFTHLKRRQSKKTGASPHKPVLLLSAILQIESKKIIDNVIRCTPQLEETFGKYMRGLTSSRPEIASPFYHLKGDKFWHHKPNPGFETKLNETSTITSKSLLNELVSHAFLDEALFEFLTNSDSMETIRQALIQQYFPNRQHDIDRHSVGEQETQQYKDQLLNEIGDEFRPMHPESHIVKKQVRVRKAGFRQGIMELYKEMCAVCKLRIVTTDGRSAAQAAHIIPFNVSYNDDVRNGISLCPLHHWAFDEGLISLTDNYQVIVSETLSEKVDSEGAIKKLHRKNILLPDLTEHNPAREAMAWHREKVFNRAR